MGIGGVGANAVQGARIAGATRILAVDPSPFNREQAKRFGATHTFASAEDARAALPEGQHLVDGESAGDLVEAEAVALPVRSARSVTTVSTQPGAVRPP